MHGMMFIRQIFVLLVVFSNPRGFAILYLKIEREEDVFNQTLDGGKLTGQINPESTCGDNIIDYGRLALA